MGEGNDMERHKATTRPNRRKGKPVITAATRRPAKCRHCGNPVPCPIHRRRRAAVNLTSNQTPNPAISGETGTGLENVASGVAFSPRNADNARGG